jgi:hypothetical protein
LEGFLPSDLLKRSISVELLAICLIAMAAMFVLSQFPHPQDNRQEYLRDLTSRSMALLTAGPEIEPGRFDTPNHELILHDGTAHQNPAVIVRYDGRFPFRRLMQYRYYPLTLSSSGTIPHFSTMQARINRTRLRKHQILAIVTMDEHTQQQAVIRENRQQLTRGVSRAYLAYDSKGRKR